MLKEIRCEIFQEKVIQFHKGLNVVMGDNEGSNSIGKSTLLMIVDFIFGGTSYISHNKDVALKLGHHDFFFTLEFNGEKLYFCRGTENPDEVFECNKDYDKKESIKIEDYRKKLKEYYGMSSKDLTFRSSVSLFSRVWGKNNYDVKRPLHTVSSEKNLETVTRVIKLFDLYDVIAKEDDELKELNTAKKVIRKAGNIKVIPKINKRKYDKNIKEIEKMQVEIDNLSKSMYSPIINISEVISDEILQLREKKKFLMNQRDYYKHRFNRTNKTISKSNNVKFESLLEFFPNVNLEKLKNIEEFHEGISSILSEELKKAKRELTKKINSIEEQIQEVNEELESVLNPNKEENVFIDHLIELSSKVKDLKLENGYFEKLGSLSDSIEDKEEELKDIKESIVNKIETTINSSLNDIYNLVHNGQRTPPILNLQSNNYEYRYVDNTGTGNAYGNLIVFDLAIFTLTDLPFIIHDSFLFKNIETSAVENIISYYNSFEKQSFIAIDVINIYSKETQEIIEENRVIQLTKDKLLFTADWRDRKSKA
ncbi:DUF2326 domain-containing protein [Bacillus mycoides]|uniref:DUF2326 domain-containing protein n=1 Tax=Bacillus mycoides TaxID=1405 RepID=UPI002E1D8A55|nr:DUF2326 domain-containing protein [Bacillus mycoides]